MVKKDLKLFISPPILNAPRITLRKITNNDLYDVFDYASNPNVSKYLLWSVHECPEQTAAYLRLVTKMYRAKKFYDFGVIDKASGRMIGSCGFSSIDIKTNTAEVGCVLNEKYWGRGLATEAVGELIRYAQTTLKLDKLYAEIMENNISSKKLFSKLGFIQEKSMTYTMEAKGRPIVVEVYSLALTPMS